MSSFKKLSAYVDVPCEWVSATAPRTDKIDQFKSENAKLREDLEFERSENGWAREFLNRIGQKCGTKDCPSLVAYVTKLEAENAKLRELVRDAWGSGHPDKSCGDCEIRDECHDDIERLSRGGALRFSRCLFELRIEDRMRELGIEVPT